MRFVSFKTFSAPTDSFSPGDPDLKWQQTDGWMMDGWNPGDYEIPQT